uniref:Uncharacterized protein n=1 Tax=uncultured prokaryote TaxID=198431 RepID=A0A0H5PVM0_9ZZZZ|nr:hypothetical protein [uncultured prokaryote]
MAYPKQFTKFSFLHLIDDTDETAQTDINITTLGAAAYGAASVQPDWEAVGQDVCDAYALLWTASDMVNGSYSTFIGTKIASIGTDGHYLTDAATIEKTTPTGGTGSDVLPQSTVVISLRSDTTFGKANFGRMYLPHTRGDLGDTYDMTPARALGISVVGAAFIGTMNDLADDIVSGAGVVILSQTGSGVVKGVARVGVGVVTDTQRRRRRQLIENYQFSDV